MLVVFEGPRNSGKTTVIERIKDALKEEGKNPYSIKFQRTSKPIPPVFMTDFLTKNYLALIDSRSVCILDRFHLTEFVMRSLDKEVPLDVLTATTHMIDYMLKNCGAVTYILEADMEVRDARLKLRDELHRKKEWPSYRELDGAWLYAKKNFKHSSTHVKPNNTPSDTEKIVKSVLHYIKGGKLLEEKIPFQAPILRVDEFIQEVAV